MRRFFKILFFIVVFFVSIGAGAIFFLSCSNEHREYTHYASGKVKEEFIYPNKEDKKERKNYTATLYYENGSVHAKQTVTNGKRNGDYWVFYENGMVNLFKMYKNDTLHGIYQEYAMNGEKTLEALYFLVLG